MARYQCLYIYTDGASRNNSLINPGAAAWGYIIFDDRQNELKRAANYIGNDTAASAEYKAISNALDAGCEFCRGEIHIFSDVDWMVKQLDGTYGIRSEKLRPLFDEVKQKSQRFRKVNHKFVPRENPKLKLVDKIVEDELLANGFSRR